MNSRLLDVSRRRSEQMRHVVPIQRVRVGGRTKTFAQRSQLLNVGWFAIVFVRKRRCCLEKRDELVVRAEHTQDGERQFGSATHRG